MSLIGKILKIPPASIRLQQFWITHTCQFVIILKQLKNKAHSIALLALINLLWGVQVKVKVATWTPHEGLMGAKRVILWALFFSYHMD